MWIINNTFEQNIKFNINVEAIKWDQKHSIDFPFHNKIDTN